MRMLSVRNDRTAFSHLENLQQKQTASDFAQLSMQDLPQLTAMSLSRRSGMNVGVSKRYLVDYQIKLSSNLDVSI